MSQLNHNLPQKLTVEKTRNLFKTHKKDIRFCYFCHKSFKRQKDKIIHHIDATGDWENGQYANNTSNNLMILHQGCHMKLHWKKVKEQGGKNLYSLSRPGVKILGSVHR